MSVNATSQVVLKSLSRATLAGLAIVAVSLLAAPAQAQIDTYTLTLKNGNTFTSVQRPQVADFDETKILIHSLGGHVVALDLDSIEKVDSVLEFSGFGTLINKTTILVGQVANDAIEPEAGDLNAALSAGGLPPNLSSILINQPFFGGDAAQGLSDSPFTSGAAGSLEAEVFDILPP